MSTRLIVVSNRLPVTLKRGDGRLDHGAKLWRAGQRNESAAKKKRRGLGRRGWR